MSLILASNTLRPVSLGVALVTIVACSAFGQDWRAEAELRIDQHRKSDVSVLVTDASGNRVEGADVRIEMTRHAYRFGTAVQSPLARSSPRADLSSTDLDLGEKTSALRVRVDVPAGSSIDSAYIQFTADKNDQRDPTSVTLFGQFSDDAPDFNEEGVLSRPGTDAMVEWTIPHWLVRGESGAPQQSPDLTSILQEIVNRPGWSAGQHVALILTGSGKRSAQTYDQDPDAAARLVVLAGGTDYSSRVEHGFDDGEETVEGFYSGDAERYRREITRLFNFAAPGNALKWRPWEQDSVLAEGTLEWLTEREIPIHAHVMIWSSWRWNAIPVDVENNQSDVEYVRRRARDHITKIATAYSGRVPEWDVLNEPLHETDLEEIVGYDDRVEWFKLARAADPHARLFVNEFDILEDDHLLQNFKVLVHDLISKGADVGGIGIQGHFLGRPPTPTSVVQRFASLAELGLPLQITEFDMSSGWTDAQQERFMEEILIATFAEPATTGFTMWGFWDGNHWLGNAPLYTTDWLLKPSGRIWMDYVHGRWWTNERGATDLTGRFDTRVFSGEHRVTVTYGADLVSQEFETSESGTPVHVALPTAVVKSESNEPPGGFALEGVYPNPFTDWITVRVTTDKTTDVTVDAVDMLGRATLLRRRQLSPGTHEIRVETSSLAAGAYLIVVWQGSEREAPDHLVSNVVIHTN